MREYGQIQCSYWTDPDIKAMSDQAKLLGAYLLTSSHTASLGAFRLPNGYVQEDLAWSSETVSERFAELLRNDFASVDNTLGWVLIPKFLNWNPIKNPNVGKKVASDFLLVPRKFKFYGELIASLKRYGNHLPDCLTTVIEQYRNIDPDPDPDPSFTKEEKVTTESSSVRGVA